MHVDFPQDKTPYDLLEDFVVVAGDTSNGLGGLKFLNKLKNKGHQVFAVDGNHEHYANRSQGRFQPETEASFFEALDQAHSRILPGNVQVIGFNGWYNVRNENVWAGYMNEHHNTLLSGEQASALAIRHAQGIRNRIRDHDGPSIVVTHTAPCQETLNPEYEGHFSNEWYWNPHMSEVMTRFSDKILVWCHGHSHAPADKVVHGVRVVSNPRGYPGEVVGWKPKTVEVSW
jgi:DNA repair exonuclease SbcCD nuclease subunit